MITIASRLNKLPRPPRTRPPRPKPNNNPNHITRTLTLLTHTARSKESAAPLSRQLSAYNSHQYLVYVLMRADRNDELLSPLGGLRDRWSRIMMMSSFGVAVSRRSHPPPSECVATHSQALDTKPAASATKMLRTEERKRGENAVGIQEFDIITVARPHAASLRRTTPINGLIVWRTHIILLRVCAGGEVSVPVCGIRMPRRR